MLQAALVILVAAILVPALDVQVPLGSPRASTPSITIDDDRSEWALDRLPNPNATDNLVFETVHSLLQHWPNTRMRNGHNIVPGSIPKGTLLHHGTYRSEPPPGPEWVATDPEHSYVFCGKGPWNAQQLEGCWQYTFMTTRPLKIVYFDGSSAAKIPYGSLDTQELIIWGKVDSEGKMIERQRINDLCDWGKKFGVDGFVRMEMDFEVMLCNFTSGVDLVSSANLANRASILSMISEYILFEVTNSGSWHNHFPGETRVHLDLTGLISFYDTQLAPSLVDVRVGQERWDHRVQNVSSKDLSAAKSRLERVLTGPAAPSSGVDWKTLIQVIVDRFGERLELVRYLLNSPATMSTTTTTPDVGLVNNVQTQLRVMLAPYLILSAVPTDPTDETDLDWAIPIFKTCATTHTDSMGSPGSSMTDSEKLFLRAVRGTSREICRVVTRMWVASVYAGVDPVLNTKESPDVAEVTRLWNGWKEDLDGLMAWLDWSLWIKCDPLCRREEMCYLPTWPNGFPRGPDRPGGSPPERPPTSFEMRSVIMESLAEEMESVVKPGPDDWIRPQPRCIRRMDPYDY